MVGEGRGGIKVKTGLMYEWHVERRQVQQDLGIMHMAGWVL